LNYTVTGVASGQYYRFKVTARNQFGFGSFSNELNILAAQIPDAPQRPFTIFAADKLNITWNMPYSRGSPILGYKVYIIKSDGSYS